MRVLVDIEEKYASILTITAIGVRVTGAEVITYAIDLSKHNCIKIENDKATSKYLEEIAE